MGAFGLTLDVNNALMVGAGGGLPSEAEVEYMLNANLGLMGRGSEYAIGGEVGASYMYAPEYESGNHILGWNGGIRGDFLTSEKRVSFAFWGLRLSLGYKGERYIDESIEHGIYASIMFQGAWQDRCIITDDDGWACTSRRGNGTLHYELTNDCLIGLDECSILKEYPVENGTAFSLGIGPYAAYFPGSGRGEFGVGVFVGADPFII